jgi:hypothetical protein
MNRTRNSQLADIINCAIAYVNEFPELKNQGLKVDTKDCKVESVSNPHEAEIGALPSIMPPYWKVHIKSDNFPGPHKYFIATVEREVGGSLAVTNFVPAV